LKYEVLSRGDALSGELADRFHRLAGERGLIRSATEPDVVVSIGGDGTLLEAFHLFRPSLGRVAFVGIHTGHLGFFADWQADELEQLVACMADSKPDGETRIVRYPLVSMEIHLQSGERIVHEALNEVTVRRREGTLVARVDLNDQLFEMFRGDGFCISSPIGSTAYNKSLGGAIIHPTLESIQITEMASINNRVFRTLGSPIILPKHHVCDIVPNPGQTLAITVDHLHFHRDDVVRIRCKVSDGKVSFIRYRPFPFWQRVREGFIQNGKEE
jgi:NAD+ kinase